MRVLKDNEIAVFLNKYDVVNIEFVAFLYSSWHLDTLYSWFLTQQLTKGLILVLPQSDVKDSTRYRLSEKNFVYDMGPDVSISFIRDARFAFSPKGLLRLCLSNITGTNPFYILNPGGINYFLLSQFVLKSRKIRYIQLDEGTSTYLPQGKKGLLVNTSERSGIIDYLIRNGKIGMLKVVKFFLRVAVPVGFQKFYLFKKNGASLQAVNPICMAVRNYYQTQYANLIGTYDPDSIFLLKDFDDEVMDAVSLTTMYTEIFEHLREKKLTVYLKKHPNDRNEDFNMLFEQFSFVKLIESEFSAEALIVTLKPSLVLGGISTSLFTIPSIFNIPTCSYMLEYRKYRGLNPKYADRIAIFYKLFNHVSPHLRIIQDLKEL